MINKVFVDNEGLIRIWVVGDQTPDSVREMGEKIAFYIRQLRSDQQPVFILDDLRRIGETNSEVRREVAHLAKTLDYDRAAMVGDGSLLMRYGTNLMLKAVGHSHARYFGNEETAVKWLRTGAPALGSRS